MKTLKHRDGTRMPVLGLGTSQLTGESGARAVQEALQMGYRLIDTAEMYGNHDATLEGIRNSGVPREDIFITTKIPPGALHGDDVHERVPRYLEELGSEYIDLLLIHWPDSSVPVSETLEAMQSWREKGVIRSLGVSNFTKRHLAEVAATGIEIVNNQIELHPTFNQRDLQEYCDREAIVLTAYAPLGRGRDMHEPTLEEIAQKHCVSVPQVALNWIIRRGIVAIPKASSPVHLQDNLDALNLQLSDEDDARIWAIRQSPRAFNPSWAEFGD